MPLPLSTNPIRDTSLTWLIPQLSSAMSPTFDFSGATIVGIVCDAALFSTEWEIHSNIDGSSTVVRCYNDSGSPLSVVVGSDRIVLFEPTDLMALRFIAFMPNLGQLGGPSTVTLIIRPL